MRVDWLLIGGERHGDVIETSGEMATAYALKVRVRPVGAELQKYCSYWGETYILGERSYRIGIHNATPAQKAEVPKFIAVKNLRPLEYGL